MVNEASRHDEHIGIVVLADEVGHLWNPAQSGAHGLVFVERHADALAAAADCDARIYLLRFDAVRKGMAEVRIVTAVGCVCAVVLVPVAMSLAVFYDVLLQLIACMVGRKSDCFYFHGNGLFRKEVLHLLVNVLCGVAEFLVKNLVRS